MISFKEHHTTLLANKLIHTYFTSIPRESVIRIAKMNKVLYQLGHIFSEFQKSNEWLEISRRRNAQIEELIKFNDVAGKIGLRYVIIKTFRFPGYVPDDIDVLIHPKSRHLTQRLIVALVNKHGYFLRSRGTTEITLRKIIDGTYVDFDIHLALGAGYYVYLDSKFVFENFCHISLEDISVPVVNKKLDFIICAAHAIMKEFELTLADLLSFLHLLPSIEVSEVLDIAERVGLKNATYTFWKLSQILIQNILRRNDVVTLPYRVPIHLTIHSYIENVLYRINFNGIKPLKYLLTFPRAKNVKKLIGLR